MKKVQLFKNLKKSLISVIYCENSQKLENVRNDTIVRLYLIKKITETLKNGEKIRRNVIETRNNNKKFDQNFTKNRTKCKKFQQKMQKL